MLGLLPPHLWRLLQPRPSFDNQLESYFKQTGLYPLWGKESAVRNINLFDPFSYYIRLNKSPPEGGLALLDPILCSDTRYNPWVTMSSSDLR